MTTGATGQLGLALPVQGELSGTWGNTVNNGITEYVNIAISGTLSFAGDGAITLANTTGDASATNIGSTTAQYMAIRVTGTLTTTKIITAPSYSKTYVVDNAATGGSVTFKASGQTGVSIAVGEQALVFFNGTDYVKVASSVNSGVTSFSAGTTGLTPSTSTTGAVTLAGTLAVANGGTGVTTSTGSGSTVLSTSPTLTTPILGTPQSGTLTSCTGLPISTGVSGLGTNVATALAVNVGSSGALVTNGGALGTPSSGTLSSCTVDGTNAVGYRNIPPVGTKTSSYTLATTDVGKYVLVGTGGSIVIPNATFASGDVVSIVNNINTTITITCSISSAFIAGVATAPASMTLAARGVATVLFTSGTVCVVSGNVS